jgi:hypothetical protein
MKKKAFFLAVVSCLVACSPTQPMSPQWVGEMPTLFTQEPSSQAKKQPDAQMLSNAWHEGYDFSFIGESKKEVKINTCNDLIKAYAAKEEPLTNIEWNRFQSAAVTCYAIKAFSEAKPSTQSYLGNFALTKETINKLPVDLAFIISNDDIERSKPFKTLGEYQTNGVVEVKSQYSALFKSTTHGVGGFAQNMNVLAKGDFTGDGIEDILISVLSYPTDGTMRVFDLFIITQTKPDGDYILQKRVLE